MDILNSPWTVGFVLGALGWAFKNSIDDRFDRIENKLEKHDEEFKKIRDDISYLKGQFDQYKENTYQKRFGE